MENNVSKKLEIQKQNLQLEIKIKRKFLKLLHWGELQFAMENA